MGKIIPVRIDPFTEETYCAEKQAENHKKLSPLKHGRRSV